MYYQTLAIHLLSLHFSHISCWDVFTCGLRGFRIRGWLSWSNGGGSTNFCQNWIMWTKPRTQGVYLHWGNTEPSQLHDRLWQASVGASWEHLRQRHLSTPPSFTAAELFRLGRKIFHCCTRKTFYRYYSSSEFSFSSGEDLTSADSSSHATRCRRWIENDKKTSHCCTWCQTVHPQETETSHFSRDGGPTVSSRASPREPDQGDSVRSVGESKAVSYKQSPRCRDTEEASDELGRPPGPSQHSAMVSCTSSQSSAAVCLHGQDFQGMNDHKKGCTLIFSLESN